MSLFFGKRSRPKRSFWDGFSLGIGCSYCRILLLVDISCRNVDIIIAMFDINFRRYNFIYYRNLKQEENKFIQKLCFWDVAFT